MKSCVFFLNCTFALVSGLNNRPIIGVVTEEEYSHNETSKIYSSYVKFIEASGGRVVPIWIYKPLNYYEDLLSKINGVLFPGGGVNLNSQGYGRTGRIIFDIATQINDKGDYFPLWGTCLGFEMLNYLAVNKLWMKACAAEDWATNINLVNTFKNSKIFHDLDISMLNTMQNEKVAIHFHQWCLTPQNYSVSGLDKYFKILAINQDSRNLSFVSIVEAHKYPFYGVSFHPEKVIFEWAITKTHHNVPHGADAVKVSQFFGNFFVNEARKSNHTFPTEALAREAVIYNYVPTYTGKLGKNTAEQIYYFNNSIVNQL